MMTLHLIAWASLLAPNSGAPLAFAAAPDESIAAGWIIAGVVAVIIVLLIAARSATAVRSAPKFPPRIDLSVVPEHFVVFDLETTGLNPERHEIIEIGAIKVNRDSDVHQTFQALVKPVKRIPKRITEITGITQAMVIEDGEPPEQVMKDFLEFIEDLPLVTFNAQFDMAFLRNAARQHNIVIHNRASCALTMARRAWPGRKSYRLCDLAKDCNLSDEDTHRALGDCKRALIIYGAAAVRLGAG